MTRVLSEALAAFRGADKKREDRQVTGSAVAGSHRGLRLPGRAPRHARGRAGAQPQRARVRADPGDARPRRRRSPSSASSPRSGREHCSYKHSKPLLKTFPDHRAAGAPGPRRERRRAPPAGWLGGRVQDRVAQPSVGGRALPGRGDRRRRHPARRVHHGRAPGRDAQQPALRPAGPAAQPLPVRRRRERHRRLRQLRRRADPRRRGRLRAGLQRQPAGQRDVRRAAARGRPDPGRGRGRRQRAHRRRRAHRPRRHPRRELRVGGAVGEERGAPARRCRWAIRSPRSCCSRRASS